MAAPNLDLAELVARPREALDIEVKEWLDLDNHDHRAKVAKEIIALANHGGGHLIIGLIESAAGEFSFDRRMSNETRFSQDVVQDIVEKYVEPTVQCALRRETTPSGEALPIITVPGGHRVPVKAKAGSPDGKLVAGRAYIRRPGPKSEEPRSAAEWDQLFERCIRARTDELLDTMRALLSGSATDALREAGPGDALETFRQSAVARWEGLTRPLPTDAGPRFPNGYYEVAAAIEPQLPAISLTEFKDRFRSAVRNHSGWPPFVYLDRDRFRPRPVDGALEAWIGPDEDGVLEVPAHSDFWRVSPVGLFFTRFGFAEDGRFKGVPPGTSFDITNSTWRIGECLLEIFYVAQMLGAEGRKLQLSVRLVGLGGRHLISLGNPRRIWSGQKHVSTQDQYETRRVVEVSALDQKLPEVVFDLLAPAYELFDFFTLPKFVVEEELRELRRNQYSY